MQSEMQKCQRAVIEVAREQSGTVPPITTPSPCRLACRRLVPRRLTPLNIVRQISGFFLATLPGIQVTCSTPQGSLAMSRCTSTNSSNNNTLLEESIPTLPILTRLQLRRFIKEQQMVIESLIQDFLPNHQVFYTLFDTPRIVRDGALEEIMCIQEALNEIIFNQERQSVWIYHTRRLPKGTFTLR